MHKEGVEAQAAWRLQTKEPELLFGLASVDFATLEHTEKLGGEAGGFLLVGGKPPVHSWWGCLSPEPLELL